MTSCAAAADAANDGDDDGGDGDERCKQEACLAGCWCFDSYNVILRI